jgi:hypothetical protein
MTSGPTGSNEAPWRAKLQAVIVILVGLLAVGAGSVGIYFHFHDNAELDAYRSATPCASAADALSGERCLYSGAATVTGNSRDTTLSVELTFEALSGRAFTARFATDREPAPSTVSTGANVTAELWSGHVTRFEAVRTVDSPENVPDPNDLLIGGVIFVLAGGVVTLWGIQFAQKAWR